MLARSNCRRAAVGAITPSPTPAPVGMTPSRSASVTVEGPRATETLRACDVIRGSSAPFDPRAMAQEFAALAARVWLHEDHRRRLRR